MVETRYRRLSQTRLRRPVRDCKKLVAFTVDPILSPYPYYIYIYTYKYVCIYIYIHICILIYVYALFKEF